METTFLLLVRDQNVTCFNSPIIEWGMLEDRIAGNLTLWPALKTC